MKILVTGGAGFIGSNLVENLIENGHEVDVWDNLSSGSIIHPKCNFSQIDICNPEILNNNSKYEIIFHLAADSRVQTSIENPLKAVNSNILGTVNILELARFHKSRVVYAGSSTAENQYNSPYSFTKWSGEECCKLYNKLFGINLAIARFFNVYGPNHSVSGAYANVIGIFERQRKNNENLTITGNGMQKRDFIHVYDVVSGLIKMAEKNWNGEIFNLGTGKNYTILSLAAFFNSSGIKFIDRPKGEDEETLADISFSKNNLNWEPKIDVKDYIINFVNKLNN